MQVRWSAYLPHELSALMQKLCGLYCTYQIMIHYYFPNKTCLFTTKKIYCSAIKSIFQELQPFPTFLQFLHAFVRFLQLSKIPLCPLKSSSYLQIPALFETNMDSSKQNNRHRCNPSNSNTDSRRLPAQQWTRTLKAFHLNTSWFLAAYQFLRR